MQIDNEELSALVRNGLAEQVEDGSDIEKRLVSAFAFTLGRLDWRKARVARFVARDPASKDGLDVSSFIEGLSWFAKTAPADSLSKVVVIFDDDTASVRVRYQDLADFIASSRGVPCHKYFVPEDVSWCINWTMENEIYFGFPRD